MIKCVKHKLIRFFDKQIRKSMNRSYPGVDDLRYANLGFISVTKKDVSLGKNVLLYGPYHVSGSAIGDYTYVAMNAYISQTTIGKFCSIGPNLICGWGIHPTNGISTSPMFYSTMKQNGMTLSETCKIEERKPIVIGNDVFIGPITVRISSVASTTVCANILNIRLT